MKYLLDTHAFLWFINDDSLLSARARSIVEIPESTIYLSVASIWEMAVKISLGKLNTPLPLAEFVDEQLWRNSISLLEIRTAHAGQIATLPFHHRDLFDRLIIAQSLIEELPIIGRDSIFDEYGVRRRW